MDLIHEGVLRKFEALKGKMIIGKAGIKGVNSIERLPPDQYVPEAHILHNLVRGFYKPAGKPYILSYQATESDKNYGKQIIWMDMNQDQSISLSTRYLSPRGAIIVSSSTTTALLKSSTSAYF